MAAKLAEAGIRVPADVTAPKLSGLPRMTDRRANRLVTSFIGAGQLYSIAELLVPEEIPVRWAGRLAEALGDDAGAVLRADPWRLLALPDAAVGQADRLARAIEPDVRRDDPRRGRALVEWTLARFARDGHTAAPESLVADGMRPFGVEAPLAIGAALATGGVVRVADPAGTDEPWIARKSLSQAESAVAEGLARLIRTASTMAGERAVKGVVKGLDDVQAGAVSVAAAHGVSLLTGGPGTGKSRTVAAIVALCRKVDASIALAAPTGRAAKRLEELAGALIAAIPDGTHLVIVGDPAQLPSIGPGRVLGDLIDSGMVPVTELKTLYRQTEGGSIARLAIAVRAGDLVRVDDPTHEVVV